jgi:thiol-disulfide isomerase/thioredoxin
MKKNRVAIYMIAWALVFSSCSEKKHGAFVVTGTIENAPRKKILLTEIPFDSNQPTVLDSTSLKENGSFTLRGRADEESIYRVTIDNGPDVVVINDNNTIRIKLDVNNYRSYKVEGSPATESLHQLFEDYRTKDSSLLVTFKQIDTLAKTPANDSLLSILKVQRDLGIKDLNTTVKTFIENSESPAARFYALGLASRTMSPEELKPMAEASLKKFPSHSGLARVKSMLAVKTPTQPTQPQAYGLLNQLAPDLTMQSLSGAPLSISSFKGKYVLVDFWASWCGPCRQENPNVLAAYNRYKDKNFTVLGVSLDKDKEAWKEAVAKDNLKWSHMSDLKQWESQAVQAYQFDAIPFNVLLDPEGKIIASGLRGEELGIKLGEILK